MKKLYLILAACIFSTTTTIAQLSDSLIANYSFNDTTATDLSGNGNNGTKYNVTPTSDRFGNANHAFSFNGTSSYITLPDSLLTNNLMSVSLWFKAGANGGAMIGHQNTALFTTPAQYVPILYLTTDSLLKMTFWGNGTGGLYQGDTNCFDDGWHHLVVAGNQTEQKAYFDNYLIATGNGINNLTNMVFNQIGVARTQNWVGTNNGWFYFEGDIDDVRIYHRKLDSTDVHELYNLKDPKVSITTISETICDTSTFQFSGESLSTTGTYYDTLTNVYNKDSIVILNLTVQNCSPSNSIFENKIKFIVSPNPAKDFITVSSESKLTSLSLISLNGKTVTTTNQSTINLSGLPKGIYILRINSYKGITYKKVIKE